MEHNSNDDVGKEQDKSETTARNKPTKGVHKGLAVLLSRRWRFTYMVFCVNILLYMHRVNLSLAIACMTGLDTDTNISKMNDKEPEFNGTGNTNTRTSNLTNHDTNLTNTEPKEEVVCGTLEKKKREVEPELNWEKTQVSFLLSSYFYGSLFTQVPGGRFADRFGGKHVITLFMVITAICSILTPICARTSIILVFIIRVVLGLAGGAVVPASICMLSAWAPPDERPVMIAFSITGMSVGTILSYQTSGLLCVYGFDNGWPSIFYLQGVFTVFIAVLWCIEVSSSPALHTRISKAERQYIQNSITHAVKTAANAIPWKSLFTSRPMLASTVTHFGFNWTFSTVLITVPLFLKEVLKFDIQENGLFSSLPFICSLVFMNLSGKMSSIIISRHILGHLFTRRLFTFVAMTGFASCLIFAGHLTCELRHISVVLLCLGLIFASLMFGGFFANHTEFAGQFSGTVYGITNAGAEISTLLSSLLAGLLTLNGTKAEWQTVFYLSAGINFLSALVFVTCSSVTLQPWAKVGLEEQDNTTENKL